MPSFYRDYLQRHFRFLLDNQRERRVGVVLKKRDAGSAKERWLTVESRPS